MKDLIKQVAALAELQQQTTPRPWAASKQSFAHTGNVWHDGPGSIQIMAPGPGGNKAKEFVGNARFIAAAGSLDYAALHAALAAAHAPASPIVSEAVPVANGARIRQQFEQWAKQHSLNLQKVAVCYVDDLTQNAYLGWKACAALSAAVSPIDGGAGPGLRAVLDAAWVLMVEQQNHHAEGWSMAKTWAFDKLRQALEPFRTEAGDELDYSKIGAGPVSLSSEGGGPIMTAEQCLTEVRERLLNHSQAEEAHLIAVDLPELISLVIGPLPQPAGPVSLMSDPNLTDLPF